MLQAQGISTSGSTGPTAADIAAEVWTHLNRTLTSAGAGGATAAEVRAELAPELARIDASVSSRLAAAGYTAPPTAVENADAVWSKTLP